MFNFDNSYKKLNKKFYSVINPDKTINPTVLILNNESLGDGRALLLGEHVTNSSKRFDIYVFSSNQ